jgi:hypothetical protein
MNDNGGILLWHDDVRPAPEGWTVARTNKEAQIILAHGNVEDISMDHDLGAKPEDGLLAKGNAEETGLDLVKWMIEHKLVPSRVNIHSWNFVGAKRMWYTLHDAGYEATIRPFSTEGFCIDKYITDPQNQSA